MDYFVDHFLSRIKRPLALAVDLGVMVFLVFILYEMPGLILGETYKMEILNIPTYILSLPMLIGIATILLLYIHRIHNFFGDGSATETQRHEEGEIVKGSG
jgi:TRAP-type C4-dicarboxylate transport system permease small subunit